MARAGRRKFDTFVVRYDGTVLEVPVWAVRGDYTTKDMTFEAVYAPAGLSWADSDINALRRKVESDIKSWAKVDWALFMKIRVESHDPFSTSSWMSTRGMLIISYQFLLVGTSRDGTQIHIEAEDPYKEDEVWNGTFDRDKIGQGRIHRGSPDIRDRDDEGHETVSLVPATVKNVAGIRKICKSLGELSAKVRTLFEQDSVVATLAQIAIGSRLLPSPKDIGMDS